MKKKNYRLNNEVIIGTDGIITNLDNIMLKIKKIVTRWAFFIRKLSINKLTGENKRIGDIDLKNSLITKNNIYNIILIDKFINILLLPIDWLDEKKWQKFIYISFFNWWNTIIVRRSYSYNIKGRFIN